MKKTTDFKKLVLGSAGRKKTGKWAVLGLHGGEEGKQWQHGKQIVNEAAVQIRKAESNIKDEAAQQINRLGKVSSSDKNRLLGKLRKL